MLTSDDPELVAAVEKYACELTHRVSETESAISEELRRQIALAAAQSPRRAVLEEIEQPVAERHEAVDIAKLRNAADELMAALITDIAVDRRG